MRFLEEKRKPTVGIFGLTGCAGDQLAIINCEDELLGLFTALDIRDFLMASSANETACDLDIAFVEGAVLSTRDREMLREIRARSKLLVAIGTCAVWGGIAGMECDVDRRQLRRDIYGERSNGLDSSPARALHELVQTDLRISGCPIEKEEILSAVANLLRGNPPLQTAYPVCTECKISENECLLTHKGEMCCGPTTAAGCGARCPALQVPCVGCRGPARDANVESVSSIFHAQGFTDADIAKRLRTFAPAVVTVESREGDRQ